MVSGNPPQGHSGATDYSYNIGPTSYKQMGVSAPKNAATKFSDLKFHHTALDFNKAGGVVGGNKSNMSGGKRGNNSIDISGKSSHMGTAPKPHAAINNRDF